MSSSEDKYEMWAMKIKALLPFDLMRDWTGHAKSDEECVNQTHSMVNEAKEDVEEFALMGCSSQVKKCPFGCHEMYAELKKEFDDLEPQYKELFVKVQAYEKAVKTLEKQKTWYQANQIAYEEKIRVLERDLENTTNLLKYSERENAKENLEKQNVQAKLDSEVARFNSWQKSSIDVEKINENTQSGWSKKGLGYHKIDDTIEPKWFDLPLRRLITKSL